MNQKIRSALLIALAGGGLVLADSAFATHCGLTPTGYSCMSDFDFDYYQCSEFTVSYTSGGVYQGQINQIDCDGAAPSFPPNPPDPINTGPGNTSGGGGGGSGGSNGNGPNQCATALNIVNAISLGNGNFCSMASPPSQPIEYTPVGGNLNLFSPSNYAFNEARDAMYSCMQGAGGGSCGGAFAQAIPSACHEAFTNCEFVPELNREFCSTDDNAVDNCKSTVGGYQNQVDTYVSTNFSFWSSYNACNAARDAYLASYCPP
jgi:hypothetical protein